MMWNLLTQCHYFDTSAVRPSGFESRWSQNFVFLFEFKLFYCLDATIFLMTKGINNLNIVFLHLVSVFLLTKTNTNKASSYLNDKPHYLVSDMIMFLSEITPNNVLNKKVQKNYFFGT